MIVFFCLGWTFKSKPRFSKRSPVVLLGHCYLLSYAGKRHGLLQINEGCFCLLVVEQNFFLLKESKIVCFLAMFTSPFINKGWEFFVCYWSVKLNWLLHLTKPVIVTSVFSTIC